MNTLHFTISEIEPKYYADGEDAYAMRRELKSFDETEPTNDTESTKDSSKNPSDSVSTENDANGVANHV